MDIFAQKKVRKQMFEVSWFFHVYFRTWTWHVYNLHNSCRIHAVSNSVFVQSICLNRKGSSRGLPPKLCPWGPKILRITGSTCSLVPIAYCYSASLVRANNSYKVTLAHFLQTRFIQNNYLRFSNTK